MTRNRIRPELILLVLWLWGFALPDMAWAQDQTGSLSDTIHLEDVTIQSMPFRETYLESTGGVMVLTPFQLRQSDLQEEVAGLFNALPGAYMARGSVNTNRLIIRGIGSRTPYSTNRIRAYLDHIPLTTGDGVSTLEDLEMTSIGSLELIKGPASALYGSGLGGVVRFNSAYPGPGQLRMDVTTRQGSFGEQNYGLKAAGKGTRLALNGGVTYAAAEGFRENSRYARTNAFVSGRYFIPGHAVSLTLQLVDLYAEIPSSLSEEDFRNRPGDAGGSWGTTGGYEAYTKLLTGITLESVPGDRFQNHLTLFSTLNDPYERRPFNTLDEQSVNAGFRERAEFSMDRIKFSAGLEFFQEWYRWKIYETLPDSHGQLQSDRQEIRRYLNGFALAQWRPGSRWLLDLAVNMNLLDYRLDTKFTTSPENQQGYYRYRPVVSPRFGVSYAHSGKIRTYASAGHGFSAPSLEETLLPEGEVNTSLRPEKGWNLEWGNRGFLLEGRLVYDLTGYLIFLQDLLVTERVSEDIFTGVNAGKTRNAGMEAYLQAFLHPREAASRYNAGFTAAYHLSVNVFTDFTDEGTDYTGNRLPGIPVQTLHLEAEGRLGETGLSVRHQLTGQQWMNDANDRVYGAYQLFSLRVFWEHHFHNTPLGFRVFGSINNLFDTRYASMILINAPSFGGAAPRYYYPGEPRNFTLGIRFTLER